MAPAGEGDAAAGGGLASGVFDQVPKDTAEKLGMAADVIDAHPAALQLRYLQTLVEISAEKASTTIFPVPIDLLRLFLEPRAAAHAPPSRPPPSQVGPGAPQLAPQAPQRPLPPRTPPFGDENG